MSFSKEHGMSHCLPVIQEAAVPEHVNSWLLAGQDRGGTCQLLVLGAQSPAQQRAEPWSELLHTAI